MSCSPSTSYDFQPSDSTTSTLRYFYRAFFEAFILHQQREKEASLPDLPVDSLVKMGKPSANEIGLEARDTGNGTWMH